MKTAWYVEDDGEMIQAIRLMLRLLDYETRSFFDCKRAAKTLLAGEKPDIILLDINMPIVTGIDLLKYIRSRADLDALPVIMLSSEVTDTVINEAVGLGADAYLFKPVTIDELEDKIAQAIQSRNQFIERKSKNG
ncbi:MAG: response regulator [Chloroflexi bacterium]|jgi:two-component system, OmpR family, alkaline phosphatase synthesis response regulator PhoP|nr:response regulator [Chloroflexota bacterium]